MKFWAFPLISFLLGVLTVAGFASSGDPSGAGMVLLGLMLVGVPAMAISAIVLAVMTPLYERSKRVAFKVAQIFSLSVLMLFAPICVGVFFI